MTRWPRQGGSILCLMLLGAAMTAGPAASQDTPVPDIPPRNVAIQTDRSDRMTLPVYIGNSGPYPFLIDTGAQRTLLSQEIAAALTLPAGRDARIVSLSGRAQLPTALISHLRYGEEDVRDIVSPLVPEASLGSAGILGLDGLKGKKLVLDFVGRHMIVADSKARPGQGSEPDDTIVVRARSRLGQLILVDCRVGGQNSRVILDTGAQYSIGNIALLRKLRSDRMTLGPRPITVISVLGDSFEAQLVVVKMVIVGGVTLQDVPIIFTDAAPFQELGLSEKPAMLLGMQMLRLFDRITIDFDDKEVGFLLPNGGRGGRRRD